ncbi:MAG: hypothetical protein U1F36_11440 [Planctomycetota bacterium]
MRHGIHAHPADLVALEAHGGLARLRDLGFSEVSLAVSDAGGRVLMPWNGSSCVRHANEGQLWFRPRGDFGLLAPQLAPILAEGAPSPLETFLADAADAGVCARAWLRPLRNVALAAHHPHTAVQNAFGDRDPIALCPAQPPVLEYVVWLVEDLAAHAGLDSIELEGLGFSDPRRGSIRFDSALPPDPYVDFLLSVCFCTDCADGMRRTGLDVDGLRSRVRELIHARIATTDALTPRRTGTSEEVFRRIEDDLGHASMFALWSHRLATYVRMLKALRAAVSKRTRLALHVHVHSLFSGDALGAPLQVVQGHADELILSHVDESAEAMRTTWRSDAVRGQVLRAAIAPHPPHYRSADDVYTARAAVRDAGGAGLLIRSLGTLTWPTLERVAAVLRDGVVEPATAARARPRR